MKKPAGIGMVALLAVLCRAQTATPSDVRKVSWGMSPEQVMAAEPAKPAGVRQSSGETVVRYESPAGAELPGRLVYIFAEGKLVRAKYISNAQHTEQNDFIADFHAVEPLLDSRYGKAATDRAVWESDEFQLERLPYLDQDRALASAILASDPNAGLSVSQGHLKLYTQRGSRRTKIVHALTGGDSQIVHQIEFRSVEFENLENQVLRTAAPGAGQ